LLEDMTMLRKLLIAAIFATMPVAYADTLLLDGVQMAEATRADRPNRGETQARVEERFGRPTRTVAAVGEPPIARWEYPSFIVYFEFDRVIHAVPRRQPAQN
jgi:hypothetical protein